MINTDLILFLSISLGLLFSLVVLMLVKSYYHFEYLKRVNQNKFSKYISYFGNSSMDESFNIYMFRMSLIFPWFNRKPYKEDENTRKLARKVKTFNMLIFINLIVIFTYVLVLIVVFGNSPIAQVFPPGPCGGETWA